MPNEIECPSWSQPGHYSYTDSASAYGLSVLHTCTYASVSNYLQCDLEYFQQQLITRFLQPVVQPVQTIVVVTGLLQGCIWL